MGIFKPYMQLHRIYEIDEQMVHKHQIQALMIDMDNTLLPWHSDTVDEESMQWLQLMQSLDVKVCVITNSGSERTNKVMEDVGIPYQPTSLKPFSFTFWKMHRKMGRPRKHTFVVGDQLLTDIMGASFAGFKGILVEPMSHTEHKLTKINRFFERIILGRNVKK